MALTRSARSSPAPRMSDTASSIASTGWTHRAPRRAAPRSRCRPRPPLARPRCSCRRSGRVRDSPSSRRSTCGRSRACAIGRAVIRRAAAQGEVRQQVLRCIAKHRSAERLPAGGREVDGANGREPRMCGRPDVLIDDPQVRRRNAEPLAFGPRRLLVHTPPITLATRFQVMVPRYTSRNSTSRTDVGDQDCERPRCARGDSAPSAFRILVIALTPCPLTDSSKIRRMTAASVSLVRRSTCDRVPPAPEISTLSYRRRRTPLRGRRHLPFAAPRTSRQCCDDL